MHEVSAVKVVYDASASPHIVNFHLCDYSISSWCFSFMRCLEDVQDEGWAVLFLFTNKPGWTKILHELDYIFLFFPSSPPLSFPSVLNIPPAFWTLSIWRDMHIRTPLNPKFTPLPTQLLHSLWAFFCQMELYHNTNVSDVDSSSTHSDSTKEQLHSRGIGNC